MTLLLTLQRAHLDLMQDILRFGLNNSHVSLTSINYHITIINIHFALEDVNEQHAVAPAR
jgi:predicted transcriptional regulator